MKNLTSCDTYKIGFFVMLVLVVGLFGFVVSSSLIQPTYKNRAAEPTLNRAPLETGVRSGAGGSTVQPNLNKYILESATITLLERITAPTGRAPTNVITPRLSPTYTPADLSGTYKVHFVPEVVPPVRIPSQPRTGQQMAIGMDTEPQVPDAPVALDCSWIVTSKTTIPDFTKPQTTVTQRQIGGQTQNSTNSQPTVMTFAQFYAVYKNYKYHVEYNKTATGCTVISVWAMERIIPTPTPHR